MSTLSNSNTRNGINLKGIAVFILFVMICTAAFSWASSDELFVASEYEGVATELRADIQPKEFRETSKGIEEASGIIHDTIPQDTPVKMTGRLYGERGNVANLMAEVVTPRGEVEWVPLASLGVVM